MLRQVAVYFYDRIIDFSDRQMEKLIIERDIEKKKHAFLEEARGGVRRSAPCQAVDQSRRQQRAWRGWRRARRRAARR